MRRIKNINENWQFIKDCGNIHETKKAETISLPHTWNAQDGQDGGNDYFRGKCVYKKQLIRSELPKGEEYYLEFQGANSSAEVYMNGKLLSRHDGGYSTFRVRITDELKEEAELAVIVDNAPNDTVYPQFADFTFYGGLYRDVQLLALPKTHFEVEYFGGSGIAITPSVHKKNARVEIQVWAKNLQDGDEIAYSIYDAEDNEICAEICDDTKLTLVLENVRLWQGKKDPYLYLAKAAILRGGKKIDEVSARFGCRTVKIDPERGFLLNGKEYPLRGVSRHQDWAGVGNALSRKQHKQDLALILEVGANSVRLAHYQHDQYFYDLCDEAGLIVWAEIPYISKQLPRAEENTLSQMQELIVQNYNHPSIAVWGLSNEITMNGEEDKTLIENHRRLNELAHSLDKTRPTVIACVSMCNTNAEYLKIPDAVAYNHYFGWYGGDVSTNGPWFDRFHKEHPTIPIGCSEYGCEALNWHSSQPRQGDYTEEYQAYYHEELIQQLYSRKYLWATYVWNMFDFGADARAEGGENGQNHKGLVTFDRSYKKDAFYAYKAWLSDQPFVHLCSKRFIDRTEAETTVTVYSNQPEVELFVNGKSVGKKQAEHHFFRFTVPNEGESVLTAKAGDCKDEAKIRKVEQPNPDYILKEQGAVLNWFDVEAPEGRFSLNDTFADIGKTLLGKLWTLGFFLTVKKKIRNADAGSGSMEGAFNSKAMKNTIGGFTVLRLSSMLSMFNASFSKEELLAQNRRLNKIRKPKSS